MTPRALDLFAGPTRRCHRCAIELPDEHEHWFYRNKTTATGECRPCRREVRRAWYERNTEAAKRYSTKWKRENRSRWLDANRKARHGVPVGTYARMLAEQGGGCALCGVEPPEGKSLHIDHDHETGRIRSLLCDLCNRGLGYFHDDPALLESAAHYLRWWSR